MKTIRVKRIEGETFLRFLVVGAVFTHLIFVLILMIVAMCGLLPMKAGGEIMAIWQQLLVLLGYLFVGAFFAVLWALALWVCFYPGIWLYSKIRPIQIGYEPVANEQDPPG